MLRHLFCVITIFCLLAHRAQAQGGADDKYVFIYTLIQEGDGLKKKGDAKGAADRYAKAEEGLQSLKTMYPDWNKKIVDYRLGYLTDQLKELASAAPVAAPEPTKNGSPATAPVPGAAKLNVALEQPASLKEMQDDLGRLNKENETLRSKLKEALSVQPAAMDARELSKAEERLKALEKERDLLNAALEQEKLKAAKIMDPATLEKERQLVAEAKKKIAEQAAMLEALQKENAELKQQLGTGASPETRKLTSGQGDEVLALKKENEFLKAQMTALRSASAISGKGKVLEELSIAKALVSALTETNIALRTERILLEERVAELSAKVVPRSEVIEMEKERNDLRRRLAAMSKELAKRRTGPDSMPEALQRQLEVARARLEVYESAPVPYGPEESAFLKKADMTLSTSAAEPTPARKLTTELPTGTKPLFDEAQKSLDAGRLDEAEQKFLQVLRQDEKNVYTLVHLASVQLQKNRFADAEKTLKQAIAADPSDPAAHYSMGLLKYRQDKFDEALDSLSLAAKLYPDQPTTQYFLGKTFLQKGNRAQAEKALRKAIQLRPGWGEAHFSLAVVYASQHPPFKELAQWHYQKALTGGYPRDPDFEKLVEDKKTAAVP